MSADAPFALLRSFGEITQSVVSLYIFPSLIGFNYC